MVARSGRIKIWMLLKTKTMVNKTTLTMTANKAQVVRRMEMPLLRLRPLEPSLLLKSTPCWIERLSK
jgi:hypothetical protein